jgi:hypothetical protein
MSLQLKVVNRIFERLATTYGRDFAARWEGLDQNAVKSSWAYELAGFANSLDSIAWAVENLPERAPNVIEFRNLCRRAPAKEAPRLESPKFDPAIAAMVFDGLKAKPVGKFDHKAWAPRIIERHKAGAKISPTVLKMARDCIAGVL